MKSQYKRDISKEYFRPLKSFSYNPSFHPSVANNKQLVLAKNISRSYPIPEGNILRIIMYTDIAVSYATESEIDFYYSDMKEISDFEKEPISIEKVVFKGSAKSIEITNPYLIDRLYKSLFEIMDLRNILKERRTNKTKKRPSAKIIKLIATEIHNELTTVEKISSWKSCCIIGFIFALYSIGLKTEESIMTEKEFEIEKATKQVITETYLSYLSKRIDKYIIK